MRFKLFILNLSYIALIISCFISCDKFKKKSKVNNSINSVSIDSTVSDSTLEKNKQLSLSLDQIVKKKKDSFTIYLDKTSPKFKTKECFYPYIVENKKGEFKLYLKIQHLSVDWLNIKSCLITVDNNDYTISGKINKTVIKGKKSYNVETLDKPITSEKDFKAIKAIAHGKHITALLVGKNNFKKVNISSKKQNAFLNVLNTYEYLNRNSSDANYDL